MSDSPTSVLQAFLSGEDESPLTIGDLKRLLSELQLASALVATNQRLRNQIHDLTEENHALEEENHRLHSALAARQEG